MSDLPKISIIIPVYNGEEYIERCLDSISKQSYENIEIIIINDGSTDNTQLICDGYLEKECRARVVSKENEGVSVARNAGLDLAVGDYIYFADADDYVLQDGLKELVNRASETAADIVVAGYHVNNGAHESKVPPLITKDTDDFLCSIFTGKNHSALWNKLFSRKLFDKIRFSENLSYMEDKALVSEVLIRYQPSIAFLNIPVYVYFQNDKSITNTKDKRLLKQFDSYLYIAGYLNQFSNDSRVVASFAYGAYRSVWFVLRNIDIVFLKYAVSIAYDFYATLSNMKINIKNNFIIILIRAPKPIGYCFIKLLRIALAVRSKLRACFN